MAKRFSKQKGVMIGGGGHPRASWWKEILGTHYLSGGGDAPTIQASNLTISDITDTTITLNWTRGNGDEVLLLAKAGSAIDQSPADGVIYTANSMFGSGDQIGTGNYVIYNGTGTTVTVTGLPVDTVIHFRAFEFNL